MGFSSTNAHIFYFQGAAYLSTNTDDDDISIFVQDIDSRKPLSGRAKEREKRDRDRERESESSRGGGQRHDRETTDKTVKGKQREDAINIDSHRSSLSDAPLVTSPTAIDSSPATSPSSNRLVGSTASAAQASTSPTRGPMLTSQGEVDERLSKMNEAFLKSLEGLGGNARRKDKERVPSGSSSSNHTSSSATVTAGVSTITSGRHTVTDSAGSGSSSGGEPARSPLGVGFPSRDRDTTGGEDGVPRVPYGYPYNMQSLGLGLGRGHHASTSSSMLGNSEVGASQGSEEVLGRMELYEERRRSGYQG